MRKTYASGSIVLALLSSGCATSYRFVSDPDGATVYHQRSDGNALLGQSPLSFSKSGLPDDAPFVVVFEKQGYESLRVVVTPTDGAETTVDATLKAASVAKDDPSLQRARRILGQVFKIQEMVAARRFVDALGLIRELETAEPDLAEIYALKGSIYFKLNDRDQAKTAWTKALALDPALDGVRGHLEKLKAQNDQPGAKLQ